MLPAFPLPREEWDFSQVPDSELEDCFLWECSREWGGLAKKEASKGTRTSEGATVSPEIRSTGELTDQKIRQLSQLALAFGLEVDRPWQHFPRAARASASDRAEPGLYPVTSREVMLREEMDEQGNAGIDEAPFFAFKVNWSKSDNQIVVDFVEWLKSNRPADRKAHENRGNSTRDRLRMIGAMRLLHHHSLAEATELSAAVLGAPLYGKRPSWERARKGALDAYRTHFFDDWQKSRTPPVPQSYEKNKTNEKEIESVT